MPMLAPAIRFSASGVSSTRSGPNLSSRPRVARNTPPSRPTSSPRTTTSASSVIARASARLIASTSVIWAIRRLDYRAALGEVSRRQRRVQMIEHLRKRWRGRVDIRLRGRLDLLVALLEKFFLARLVPRAGFAQVTAQAQYRLALPCVGHFLGWTVARRIVGGGVVRQPVSDGLDYRRTMSRARLGERFSHSVVHSDHVVTVDLHAFDAGGDAFLRKGL